MTIQELALGNIVPNKVTFESAQGMRVSVVVVLVVSYAQVITTEEVITTMFRSPTVSVGQLETDLGIRKQ
jgi:hypothetical protein